MADLRVNLWRVLAVFTTTVAVGACLFGIFLVLLAFVLYEQQAALLAWGCGSLVFGVAFGLVGSTLLVRAAERRPVRGRCPFCKYDLRGSPGYTCSECGKTIPFGFDAPSINEPDRNRPD